MKTLLSLCLLACASCGSAGVYGPEPTGAWMPANPTQQVKVAAHKTRDNRVIVPAIDISRR